MRLLRVMCTGRIDMSFIFRAFLGGADAVFIGGCHLNECNYTTHGNFHAVSTVHLCRRLMEEEGLNPGRVRIELISSGEGNRFADVMNDFGRAVREMGPLGEGEGMGEGELREKLLRLSSQAPYLKIALREKLALRLDSVEEYAGLYTPEEVGRVVRERVRYHIDPEKCQACMSCARRCPVEAIAGGKNLVHVVDQERCIGCGSCARACPPRFGAVTALAGEAPPFREEARPVVRR